jgi:hypothetical protein
MLLVCAAQTETPHLRGRVVGQSGVPAAGLELLVRPAGLDHADGRRGRDDCEFRLRTDIQGAFQIGGLEGGTRYVVRARTAEDRSRGRDFTHLLTPEPILPQIADSDPEPVLTFSRPHVVVRLFDEEGRPWSGAEVLASRGSELLSEWAQVPSTFLYESVSAGKGTWALGHPREGEPVACDVIVYEVRAGARYLAGASGGPFDGSVQLVDVPEGADRIEVELHALRIDEDDLGTVSVRVSQRGKELGVSSNDAQFTIVLQNPLGAVALLADGPYLETSPFPLRAPPGNYRVVARGYATFEPYHGGLQRARDLGQAEALITIEPGTTREVQLELDTGGRLELTLEGQGNDTEFEFRPVAFGSEHSVHMVQLLLVCPTGAEAIWRRIDGLFQPNLVCHWPLGETHVSECLPTGPATILARLKNGKEMRVEVELREGETTRVKLSF